MTAYSVADAKTNLPRLIDRALGGEEVIITRHGKPVAEPKAACKRAAHRRVRPSDLCLAAVTKKDASEGNAQFSGVVERSLR